ncbi:MAG: SUMF1/EgtB/PvdO family nonheme iron enzyme, partial [Planctomycetota bacterium]|nr:SUMF1/EgtB/PvdO family nonheme iron enzyme [Planctomycetota bacterium]
MSATRACPARDELSAYLAGKLAEDAWETVATHVETCLSCQTVLTTIDDADDLLVVRLRHRILDAVEGGHPRPAEAAVGLAVASPTPTDGPGGAETTVLGEYRLLEKLGEGGMGAVYKARHTVLDRLVAIKVLPRSRLQDPAAGLRFLREITLIAQLNHPHVVQAYDAREVEGVRFLAMEYVDGVDLNKLVRQCGPLPIPDACELVRQAALGLQHAHEHGLVHRDIKPSNLMLTRGGQVKILDLGLAFFRMGPTVGEELTRPDRAMGTLDYMAPEQGTDAHGVDIRADLYSLGCTWYKLLTGHSPFSGPQYQTDAAKIVAHARDSVPMNQLVQRGVPAELVAVLTRLMAKSPADRYATPAEVAAVVAPFAAGADLCPLAQAAAGAIGGGEPQAPRSCGTEPIVSSPMTGTTPSDTPAGPVVRLSQPASSPLAPLLRGEGSGVRGEAASADHLVDAHSAASFNPSPTGAGVESPSDSLPPQRAHAVGVAAKRLRRRPIVLIAIGLIGVAMLAAALVIRVATDKGQITITAFDPKIEVEIRRNGQVVDGFQVKQRPDSTSYYSGEFEIEIKGSKPEGVSIKNGKFQLTRGNEVLVEIVREEKLTVTPDVRPPVAGTGPALPTGQWGLLVKSAEDLKAWQKTGAGTATFENGAVRLQDAAVTYPTVAVDLVIRVNVKIEVDVQPTAKLTLRETPAGSYAAVLEDGKKLVIGVTEGGKWRELKSAPITVSRDQPLALEFSAVGDVLTLCLNGKPTIEVRDATHRYGSPGLAVVNGTMVFNAVVVKVLRGRDDKLAKSPDKPALSRGKPPALAVAPFDAKQAKQHQTVWAKYLGVPIEFTNSIGMKFILIPPGEFMMGSTPGEIEEALKVTGDDNHWQELIKSEAPQHKVILTQPIYLGIHEVTQAQYENVMWQNPSNFAVTGPGKDAVAGVDTSSYPVEMVSWNDAADFCVKLSQKERLKSFYRRAGETVTILDGTGYRLPTEAEWEFACRAGTTTKYWIGDKDDDLRQTDWFGVKSGKRTHAVGELKANPFGLFDIHGNVRECVQDWSELVHFGQFQKEPAINPNGPSSAGSERVLRGGSAFEVVMFCRSAGRGEVESSSRFDNLGFRVALVVEAVKQAINDRDAKRTNSTTGWKGWPKDAPPPATAPFATEQARAHQEAWAKHLGVPVETTNSIGMKLVLIPPGEFVMGTNTKEIQEIQEEVSRVAPADLPCVQAVARAFLRKRFTRVTHPVQLGACEVTREQFQAFVRETGYRTGADAEGQTTRTPYGYLGACWKFLPDETWISRAD